MDLLNLLHLCFFTILNCVIIKCEHDYVIDLASRCNYNVEVHRNIETEDGYLLTVHRLLPSRKETADQIGMPVLMMHGLFGSAENFLLLDCQSSLAYLLLEEGYDVWLGNFRSVSYSRHHVSLDPNSAEYWNITLDEYGLYDLPSLIDYVLETTKYPQIMYVGHSQGNLVMYIMASNRPEYADKLKLFINLAPASLIKFPHPWLPTLCPFLNKNVLNFFGLYEWTLGRDYVRKFGLFMCRGIFSYICKYMIYLFSGLKPYKLHMEDMERFLTNGPDGISALQFIHGCQAFEKQEFMKLDLGSEDANMKQYGSITPPKYNDSKMTSPVAIYYCDNDWFLDSREALRLAADLPNIVDIYKMDLKDFTHLDFIIGRESPVVLYPRIIRLMNKFRNEENLTLKRTDLININDTFLKGLQRSRYQIIMETAHNEKECDINSTQNV